MKREEGAQSRAGEGEESRGAQSAPSRPALALALALASKLGGHTLTLLYALLKRGRGILLEPLGLGLAFALCCCFLLSLLGIIPELSSLWRDPIGQGEAFLFLIAYPTLQSALYQLGRRLLRLLPRPALSLQERDALIAAIDMLQRQQIGALIVLEQQQRLERWTDRAIQLDAKLSTELLYSLFIPSRQNPCHDGAVVLRFSKARARLLCAGAFFPLSQKGIEQRYGTRHRAALGLTEKTDACVIIVSEERRDLSWVEAGELHGLKSLDALRERLTRALQVG
ncbi:MAG: DNA integrity scanning protein DisA nucleotide-binding domain protein [Myxococcota bacterium]|nr:DNA integrity scanning protein DisA nucleotide-binding domain protein [Myxococcota bacterium]